MGGPATKTAAWNSFLDDRFLVSTRAYNNKLLRPPSLPSLYQLKHCRAPQARRCRPFEDQVLGALH